MSRRRLLTTAGAALGLFQMMHRASALAASTELKVSDSLPVDRFDFETKGLEGWTTVQGQWAVEEMAGAPSGMHVLMQRATTNQFNVIVAPPGPYTDVDVSMKFKPISGREDASGGIVFRFNNGKYYVVRANALESNFRLGGVPDVVFVNAVLGHVYVAIGNPGVIEVFDTEPLRHIQTVTTEPGAHTMAFDPTRHRLYAFLPTSHRATVYVEGERG